MHNGMAFSSPVTIFNIRKRSCIETHSKGDGGHFPTLQSVLSCKLASFEPVPNTKRGFGFVACRFAAFAAQAERCQADVGKKKKPQKANLPAAPLLVKSEKGKCSASAEISRDTKIAHKQLQNWAKQH